MFPTGPGRAVDGMANVGNSRVGGIARSTLVVLVVAGVVLAGALAGAVALRPRADRTADVAALSTSAADPTPTCAGGPCQLLAARTVADTTVRLYVAPVAGAPDQAAAGQVRFQVAGGPASTFQTDISQDNAVLTRSSLSCLSAGVPACVVSGELSTDGGPDGALGEIFVEHAGYWARPSAYMISSSAGYLTLVGGGDEPDLVTVQNYCADGADRCAAPQVYVALYTLGEQDPAYCTRPVDAISLLPGRGTTVPPVADQRPCPTSAG